MKKKLVSIMLAAIMAVSMVACGNNADAGKESTPVSSAGEETKVTESNVSVPESVETVDAVYPLVDEPITIRGVYVGDNNVKPEGGRITWNKLAEITGINIEWEIIDKEAFPVYLAGNEWPDIFIDPSEFGGQAMIDDYGVEGGRLLNIFDYIEYMPHLQKTFEDYPIVKPAITQSNGEAYGFPCVEASSTVVSARTMVRSDILDANGVTIPTTTEEFYDVLKTLKEKTGKAQWVPNLSDDEQFFAPMIYAAFGTETNMNFDDDGTGKVIFNRTSEQMKRYLTFMNRLYEEGLIHQEFLSMDATVRREATNSSAFPDGFDPSKIKASDFADGKFHLDPIAPLTSEFDDTQEILGVTNYRCAYIYVNADTEYAKEICQMLDVSYATEEVVEGSGLLGQSFCYGIEGVDWYVNDDGETYELVAPPEYDGAFGSYQFAEVIWQNTGRLDALAGLVTSTEGNSRARQLAFVKGVIPYMSDQYFPVKLLKFTEDEQYVISNKLTDIKTYYKEMEGKFITGAADLETEWESYCNTLTQMGIEDVIKVYQSSYDRWLEAMK